MSHKSAPPTVSTIGIDLGKNSFHLVGLDQRAVDVPLHGGVRRPKVVPDGCDFHVLHIGLVL